MENTYEVVIDHNGEEKRLFTTAESLEEAAAKFNRHITCHWIGYPWEAPEDLLDGTIDKLQNGANV